MADAAPLIFTHYGDTPYLARSLEAACLTNPDRRKILIGDAANRQTTLAAGWEHVLLDDYSSALGREFLSVFKVIKGKSHVSPPGDRNWVQYVLERWFILSAFVQSQGLEAFWHFDSDVMIATTLEPFEQVLAAEGYDYTKQCSGKCLNGYVTTRVAEDYCRYIIRFFRDEQRLAEYQKEFDEKNPTYALTEMEAFAYYERQPPAFRGCHLACHFPGWLFDDVLRQRHGCDTALMSGLGPLIKDVRFDGTHFTVRRNQELLKLAVLNCSWLPVSVFDWILARTQFAMSGKGFAGEDRLSGVWPGIRFVYRGLRARTREILGLQYPH
ncbi:MAG: hypothetical protein U1E93_03680 [Alphaproteobacteria bacterium]